MRILHINYYFHPIVNPRSIRWLNFVKFLSDRSHRVDVLTISPSPGFGSYIHGSDRDIPTNVNVHRTYPGLMHRLQYGRHSPTRGRTVITSDDKAKPAHGWRQPTLRRKLHELGRFLWKPIRDIMIPDQFVEWLPIAVCAGIRLMRKNQYNCIISSGLPFTDHLVAYCLKRLCPGTMWIAEYGDPWSFFIYPPKRRLVEWSHRQLEASILEKVDRIITTTEETRVGFLEAFPFLARSQVVTIPQGCDTAMIDSLPQGKNEVFTVGYIGRFDAIRDPTTLFTSLRLFQDAGHRYKYVNVGPLQECYRRTAEDCGLNRSAEFLGKRPHEEALTIAKRCDILIYWGNESRYQLPSKIWEYLALRKPILCVTRSAQDIGARIVRQYRRGLIAPCECQSIVDALCVLQAAWHKGILDQEFDLSPLREVDWHHRAEVFEHVLTSVPGATHCEA